MSPMSGQKERVDMGGTDNRVLFIFFLIENTPECWQSEVYPIYKLLCHKSRLCSGGAQIKLIK